MWCREFFILDLVLDAPKLKELELKKRKKDVGSVSKRINIMNTSGKHFKIKRKG